jgi:hypothetical protein
MKTVSRICLFGTLILVLLTAACSGQEGTPTVLGTIPGDEFTETPPVAETETTETAETGTASPEATLDMTETPEVTDTAPAAADTTQIAATDTTLTPGVPVTGADVILLECQFCIEDMAQAVLVLPDIATFETVADTAAVSTPEPDTGCNTVDTFNGKQVVICRAEENTSLNLNICVNGNCTQLLVELQDCPDQPGATETPGAGVPTNTPGIGIPTDTPSVGATDTPAVSSPTVTPTP